MIITKLLPSWYVNSFIFPPVHARCYFSTSTSTKCARNFVPLIHSQIEVPYDSALGEALQGTFPPNNSILNTINWLMKMK